MFAVARNRRSLTAALCAGLLHVALAASSEAVVVADFTFSPTSPVAGESAAPRWHRRAPSC